MNDMFIIINANGCFANMFLYVIIISLYMYMNYLSSVALLYLIFYYVFSI